MSAQTPFRQLADPSKLWGLQQSDVEQVRNNPRRMVVDLLRLFLANETPVTLWGPVGARKTRTIEGLAQEHDAAGVSYQVITLQPSTQDPTIIHGMMYTALETDGSTVMKRAVPDVAKQVVEYADSVYIRRDSITGVTTEVRVPVGAEDHRFGDEDVASYTRTKAGGYTILFADEMTTCLPAQQNAMLGLLTHGKFEGIDISPFITIAMAANPEGTVSTVNPLGEAVMNRGGHLAWFGDVDLFLAEWKSGFGTPSRAPDPTTLWYTETLLAQSPLKAFRNERWDPDGLVPYDLMEHTERAVTELARLVTLINDTFLTAPPAIRHEYLIAATRALLGHEWGTHMAGVCAMERERLSGAKLVELLRAARVTPRTTTAELTAALGDSLFRQQSGVELRQDQADHLMQELERLVLAHDTFSLDTYLTAWALAVTAGTNGQAMSLHAHLLRLSQLGLKQVRAGRLERNDALPDFVPPEMRAALQQLARQAAE